MDKRGVQIPVNVVGAKGAEAEIAALKARIAELEAAQRAGNQTAASAVPATEAAAAGTEKLAGGAKKAGDELFDFDRKGEKVVKGVLAAMSPELAQAADMAIDLAEGATKVSGALLAIAGAGAAMGIVGTVLSQMEESMRRLHESTQRQLDAMQKLRGDAIGAQAEAAELARGAGLVGVGPAMLADVARMQQQGVPRDMAMTTALAAQVANASGSEFEEQRFLSGLLGARDEIKFSGDPKKDAALLAQIMNQGSQGNFQERLDAYLRDVGPAAKRDAIDPASVDQQAFQRDAAMEELGRRFPGLKPDELRMMRRLLDFQDPTSNDALRAAFRGADPATWKSVFGESAPWDANTLGDVTLSRGSFTPEELQQPWRLASSPGVRDLRPTGADRTIGEMLDMLSERQIDFPSGNPPGRSQLTVNIYSTSVATQVNGGRPTPSMDLIEQGYTP